MHPRGWMGRGTGSTCVSATRGGLALFAACRPLPLACFSATYPPPPSPAGKGVTKSLFRRGLRPRHPGVKPFTALIDPAIQPSLRRGSLRFDVKPTERLSLEQCRQPRRGGTGGEELRRLRWSSPPGQVEQVPPGRAPCERGAGGRKQAKGRGAAGDKEGKPPPGTAAAGRAGDKKGKPPAGGKKSPTCRERQAGDAVISLSSPRRWWRFPGWTPPARPERCGRYPER